MKAGPVVLWLGSLFTVAAQQRVYTTTAGTDVNGRRIAGPTYGEVRANGVTSRTEYATSVNGRQVPREQSEERVIQETGQTRIVERLVRRYDAAGNPGPVEKQQIEETKRPDGGLSVRTTVYRADVNGNLQVAERSAQETRKSGSLTTTEKKIERPTINGGLSLAEQQTSETREVAPGRTESTATTLRPDQSGRLAEAAKVVTERTEAGGEVRTNVASYDTVSSGRLQLAKQEVSRTRKNGSGTVTEVEIYSAAVPGRAQQADGGQLSLREQQLIERTANADGSTAEKVSVRRLTGADPTKRGYETVSETVCTGKCTDEKP